jgi:CSLREA domain-containing protein
MRKRHRFLRRLLLLAATAASLVGPEVASATSISVSTAADEVAAANGSCSLREAMTNASMNTDSSGGDCASGAPGSDTISLDGISGTVATTPFWLGGLGDLPNITDQLTITGPGAGALTISNGGGDHVFFVVGASATISGLTITGAHGNGSFGGGVVTANGGSVTVDRSTITGNSTNFYGAGINAFFSFGGSVTVSESTISGNTGGGIASGGGVSLTVERSTISGNSAIIGAGLVNNGLAVLRNSTIRGNSGHSGGGIMNHGDLTIESSTISGNSAAQGAGTYTDAPLRIRNSTIAGNSASQFGGGLVGGTVLENSTVTANSAPVGAGIWNGLFTLSNTIVAGQTGSGGNCSGAIILDGGYNLEDGTSCGFSAANHSLPNTNPLLDPSGLQDNGGLTKTVALLSGSPALDALPTGTNGCGTTIATDQRGMSRPQGTACDIGAFELEQQTPEGSVNGKGHFRSPVGGTDFQVDADATGGMFFFQASPYRKFNASSVEGFTQEDNTASFQGTGTWNGASGCTYEVTFLDNGSPGRNDTIDVVVRDASGAVVYTSGEPQLLKTGNVTVTGG